MVERILDTWTGDRVIGHMLALRLRWYGEATASVLLRRWQMLLLGTGTLAPIGGSLLPVAAYPVLIVAQPGHGVAWRLGAIGLWQGCWALWALMQRDALRGGPFADFARSLPIHAAARRRIDFVVLLMGNTPLLLFFLAAGVALGGPEVQTWEAVRGALLIVFLLATQWCAQHAVLDKRAGAIPTLLVMDIWAAMALSLPVQGAVATMVPAAALSVWALLTDVPAPAGRLQVLLGQLRALGTRQSSGLMRMLPPADRITLGILYGQHRSVMLGTLFTCLLVTFAARGLMDVWDFDGRSFPMVMIAFGIVALAISNLYRPLHIAHDAARSFTATLPLQRQWWVRADTIALMVFALPFAAAMTAPLASESGVQASDIAAAVASLLALVALLRLPQLFSRRHSVVVSMLLTTSWTFACAHLLTP
jgi:hypothetical protein